MLRMSKLADYAFVILSCMAHKETEIWSAASLASETTLPLPTVAKLMKLMARGHLVIARRGAQGGYSLALPAKDISIARIIEVVDGPISLTACAGMAVGKKVCDCAVVGGCPVRESWGRVNMVIRDSLESVFLSDLASQSVP